MEKSLSRRGLLKGALAGAAGIAGASGPRLKAKGAPSVNALPFSTTIAGIAADGPHTPVPAPAAATLRALADQFGFKVGVMTGGYGKAGKYYEPLLNLQQREFNLGYVNLGWNFIEPEQGVFNWKPGDGDLQVAIDGNMRPTAGLLIWGRDTGGGLPNWVRNGRFSKDELLEVIKKRVRDVMTRYRGKFEWYQVVNEAYAEPNSPPDLLLDRIGPEYIEIAFQTARETDPHARLLYNDYDNHALGGVGSTRTAITKGIVDKLKARSLIDAVGVEMGLRFPDIPAKADVITALRSYPVPTIVSEFSVRIASLQGTTQERFKRQAEIYRDMLEAAIASGNCTEFIVFQVVDMLSGWEDPAQSDATASSLNDPTPFDDDFQPKPAYFAMRDVLQAAASGKWPRP